MKPIGKLCVCGHDLLDHGKSGCTRCAHATPAWAGFDRRWQHRFAAVR